MPDNPHCESLGPLRRNEAIERWLGETRALALAIAETEKGHGGRRLGAILLQAAVLVELVRDGFAVTVNVAGREIVRVVESGR